MLTNRFDPKKEMDKKILFLKKIETIKKRMIKENIYVSIKDEDIASRWLESDMIECDEAYATENIKKIVKKIQNARQYVENLYKERGIPQN